MSLFYRQSSVCLTCDQMLTPLFISAAFFFLPCVTLFYFVLCKLCLIIRVNLLRSQSRPCFYLVSLLFPLHMPHLLPSMLYCLLCFPNIPFIQLFLVYSLSLILSVTSHYSSHSSPSFYFPFPPLVFLPLLFSLFCDFYYSPTLCPLLCCYLSAFMLSLFPVITVCSSSPLFAPSLTSPL